MKKVTVSRRKVFRQVVAVALIQMFAVGCTGGVGEIAVLVTVIKLIAGAAVAILVVQGVYWEVKSAEADVAKKELELRGIQDGQQVKSVVTLDDDQIKTIKEKGRLEIAFQDGKKVEVPVTIKHAN